MTDSGKEYIAGRRFLAARSTISRRCAAVTASGSAMSAPARAAVSAAKARVISSRPPTSRNLAVTPNVRAALSIACRMNRCAEATQRTPTGERVGTVSLSSASHFVFISSEAFDNPVMFPPGLARPAISPLPTGSPKIATTMGVVVVACLSAATTALLAATSTSGLRRTSSAATSGNRSTFSPAHRSSLTMFRPSTWPSSRSPCRSASKAGGAA